MLSHLTWTQEIPALVIMILVTAAKPLPVTDDDEQDYADDYDDEGGD